jgi:hypothetical protein
LSSILAFSEEDREKIGLFGKGKPMQGSSNSPKAQTTPITSSFKDKFIGFLMDNEE